MHIKSYLMGVVLLALLAGCGGGGDTAADGQQTNGARVAAAFSGSVGDGPITGATVTVSDVHGTVLGTQQSDAFANYRLQVQAPAADYPLRLTATGGLDLVTGRTPDLTLTSVALSPADKAVNLNPFTTLMVAVAADLPGGLTGENLTAARATVLARLNFGLDTARVPEPITTAIDSDNVAAMVKASEALAETLRRAALALSGPDQTVSADAVLQALAADLTDGALDGRGADGANARIAALVNVLSGQVLLETLANGLRVDGNAAAPAMDQAIAQIRPEGAAGTASVAVVGAMTRQLEIALAATQAISPSPTLAAVSAALATLPDAGPMQSYAPATDIPADNDFAAATAAVLQASDAELADVNAVAGNAAGGTPPQIGGSPPTRVGVGAAYRFTPEAADADGDVLAFSIAQAPAWAEFDPATGTLSGTPTAPGTTQGIVIAASDGVLSTALPAFDLTVTAADNGAPVLSGTPAAQAVQGSSYRFTPEAGDPDGDALSFAIANKPAWASFDPATGTLSGTPQNADVGITTSGIVISVSDGVQSVSLSAFDLSVVNANDPPTVGGVPPTRVAQDTAYRFVPSASDPDGDPLSFSVTHLPAWASFDPATGTLTGTPGNADVGTTGGVAITVSDGVFTTALPPFDLTVTNVNDAPAIQGSPATQVDQDQDYRFTPAANDADGDPLSFAITNKPAWASFDPATGTLAGKPGNADVGTTAGIVVAVSDGTASASLPPFSIAVVNVNDPPRLSGSPATQVTQDKAYRFAPAASDPDDDKLSFSIVNKPAWARFDSASGTLTGTPGNADVGTTSGIVISVSDGTASASLPPFNLKVVNVNDSPLIDGLPPAQVTENESYSFTPSAIDPDGDVLSFSVVNAPAWASFDTATGTLSGTPGSADVGTTSDVTISVSDGTASASLSPFSITVTSSSAQLTWTAPVTKVDGSPLMPGEMAGYRIYSGASAAQLTLLAEISDPLTTTYAITGLAPGTYYFAVTALDIYGGESPYSNVETKVIE